MRAYFETIAGELGRLVKGSEVYLANFRAERSDFVRFNRSAVRQPGSVLDIWLALDLIEGRRHAEGQIGLSGAFPDDRARLARIVEELREARAGQEEDPHLLYSTLGRSHFRRIEGALPDPAHAVGAVLNAGDGRDLVGIYAAGEVHTGFASSFGALLFDTAESFNLDWSFFVTGDKAVKSAYAGFRWNEADFLAAAQEAAGKIEALKRPVKTVPPGEYRCYLAPAAVNELMGMLSWGGFGLAAHKTRATVFLRMIEAGEKLSPLVTICENTKDGAAPGFQREGFLKPGKVTLIERGEYRDCLISPRSAAEYGAETNGANGRETPQALDMAGGTLAEADALAALGTGIYVSNLWYLNFSDRSAGRLTGMTRFASFWVEDGAIAAPLSVMRFDDTIYRIFGSNLLGLTKERRFLLDPLTYEGRSSESALVPGALVEGLRFTL